MQGQWLYQDIVYVWIVVISGHFLCMDSHYIKTFVMYGQWLYQLIKGDNKIIELRTILQRESQNS
jgi:hypothetical protein